ncbi:MAG: dihydroneopterin aldolase [Bacillota bacterium]|nr:dihydroneopterin aldolase [Bacillota bacterium]NLD13268.1 dihydroneopterin aldolase [Bacillota bacterium]HOB89123.1 dihydroneopterin aldolase [Bacillota bacterium]HOJ58184.1 dihydroneopterin aldolase [Bacillota bacterium]HOL02500.1 dihydroneopterin aldolase [Bacillota bacterium]
MKSDKITLRNMVFYGYHGVFEGEKELGQRFEVDVELHMDLSVPGQTDDLEQGINYVDVYTIVQTIVQERTYDLVEAVAENIAETILDAYSVDYVVVRVRKPSVAMGGVIDYVEVEITRPGRR